MKMWKLSHTDVCDCDEIQTVSHRITCVDAPITSGQSWLCQPLPLSTVPTTGMNLSMLNIEDAI